MFSQNIFWLYFLHFYLNNHVPGCIFLFSASIFQKKKKASLPSTSGYLTFNLITLSKESQ